MRNVGIFAHVDHGKTTVVERMLLYTNLVRRPGEVHDGNATMDYLPQEMARGITINAAAITLPWREHEINVIDTPGHVDFTAEVERSARVLDGAVLVVDAVSGVQAQTLRVWAQCEKYGIPTVVFVNKMDREGADFGAAVASLRERLGSDASFVPVHAPVVSGDMHREFRAVRDLVSMKELTFGGEWGEEVTPGCARESADMAAARLGLVDELVGLDDAFLDALLEADIDYEAAPCAVEPDLVRDALARATRSRRAVPVLLGSAFKNKGVQPLLDAIVDYMPSPVDVGPVSAVRVSRRGGGVTSVRKHKHKHKPVAKSGASDPDGGGVQSVSRTPQASEPLTALAFKVAHIPQRGAVVYFRVYSGVLRSASTLFNSTQGVKERVSKLYKVYADDMEEVKEIGPGALGAALGLRDAATGDTVVAGNDKHPVVLAGVSMPPPVFFCAVEPESLAVQPELEKALAQVTREDPSLSVSIDEETGETILSGMGELHLEYIATRLRDELGVSCTISEPRVAYKEHLSVDAHMAYTFSTGPLSAGSLAAPGPAHQLNIELAVSAVGPALAPDADAVETWTVADGALDGLNREQREAVETGLELALQRGIVASLPLTGNAVELVGIEAADGDFSAVPAGVIAVGISKAMMALLAAHADAVSVMEPLMEMEVDVGEDYVGQVIADLNSPLRRGQVSGMQPLPGGQQRIWATVPLASLAGYSTAIRSLTQGNGTFSLAFKEYGPVPPSLVAQVLAP
ncbi:translation elongation factor G [Thecamonas trahens ATCC 50062]|uniref:Translation elongation factor G n=1 Tax=Thecamonas trahens ATCC 50062 TaxID=461836 RepID=A0A0L0DDV2_THETB|nr:translation elongation factor G [Thecamonas trahens ATCC 50062]KNC50479.1 translation elongation factor G [Thecamonas trahens ATCC 50062]|eukprot:XP_013762375.1 translation elongation factor G [Thecamonas trahens ATCC 50062]